MVPLLLPGFVPAGALIRVQLQTCSVVYGRGLLLIKGKGRNQMNLLTQNYMTTTGQTNTVNTKSWC